MKARLSKSRGGAFTLTELLTVVVVIGVLAVVLFGLTQRARLMRDQTKSIGNLRQLALGAALWSQEHSGLLPDSKWWQNPPGPRTGFGGLFAEWSLGAYLGLEPTGSPTIMTCPASNRLYPSQVFFQRTYSINCYIGIRDGVLHPPKNPGPVRRAAVERPSKMALFMTGSQNTAGNYQTFATPANLESANVFMVFPNGQAQVAFVDGHVESFEKKKFLQQFSGQWDLSPFWSGRSQ